MLGSEPAANMAAEIITPGDGQIRALIVSAGNPVLSTPNGPDLEKALDQLDLMVSLDLYINETNAHADYVLPATGSTPCATWSPRSLLSRPRGAPASRLMTSASWRGSSPAAGRWSTAARAPASGRARH